MFLVLPIRTESDSHHMPMVNYMLIGANLLMYIVFNEGYFGNTTSGVREQYLVFHSDAPTLLQFFSYQFLHANASHLLFNLLFLWVFGNGVNAKMGDWPYLFFYLGGGVFAAWGYASLKTDYFQLIGASGAIAAVTTAYLALFPRSRVTVLVWFFFIHFFELPAMVIIGVKIILWDNLISPAMSGPSNVAHQAHMAGYLFGFVGAMLLLFVRAIPRDQFDILALWKRWYRRREFASVMGNPSNAARAQFGSVARMPTLSPAQQREEDERIEQLAHARTRVSEALEQKDLELATQAFEQLVVLDAAQCMPQTQQLEIARELFKQGKQTQAAAAYDRYVSCYPNARDIGDVLLLLGIISSRDLGKHDLAESYLNRAKGALRDENRLQQCEQWLAKVIATGSQQGI